MDLGTPELILILAIVRYVPIVASVRLAGFAGKVLTIVCTDVCDLPLTV